MEIAVKMKALKKNGDEHMLMLGTHYLASSLPDANSTFSGRLSMVCRDAITHKAFPVNQIAASTSEEKALLSISEG